MSHTASTLSQRDLDIVVHTSQAIGRTGAESLDIGWLDDEPPHRWYATAQYQGAKVSCDNQDDPVKAVLGLYSMLAAGGQCAKCGRTIALEHGDRGLVDGARMHRGEYETRAAVGARRSYCVRRLRRDGWSTCRRAEVAS